ncbi:endolysin [Ralstonia phage RSJ2]|uniref:Endolysin n=1 Tax=Ralstonia phage RSJ2 TaxID=1481785 RepID=A0A068Q6I2_9CAUD|nr:endolysin [Ralstonia phage RSJ2]BAP15847.1 putative lysozyme [Ralstonia phage RSJ2]
MADLRQRIVAGALAASAAGLTFIATHEGTVQQSYADPALGWKVPTICTGHTGPDVYRGQVATKEMCRAWLQQDSASAAKAVHRCVSYRLNQPQFDALVSFTFNVGQTAMCSSTLVRKLNAGDLQGASAEFPRWNRSGGKVLPGLTNRRAAERKLFDTGAYE